MNLGTITAILAAVDAISPVVSKLTGNVGAGMGKIKGLVAGAFAVDAIVNAIGKFTEFTGKMTDLSAKTAIGTEKLQAYDRVFGAAGISIDTVANSIGEMGKRLIGGDSSAVNALGTLGLKTKDLLALSPDAAFDKIADSIAGIQNPMERATVAQDIFGKGGKDLLAALDGQIGATTQGLIDMGQVISADVVAAGDDLGDSLGALSAVGMNLLGTVLGPFIPLLTELVNWLAQVASVTGTVVTWLGRELFAAAARAKEAIFGFLSGLADAASKVPLLGTAFKGLGDAGNWLKDQAVAAGAALKETYAGMRVELQDKTAPAVKTVADIVGVYGENAKAASEKAAKLAEEQAKANEAFRASVVNIGDTLGPYRHFQVAVEDSRVELDELRDSMEAMETITANTNWVEYAKGMEDTKASAQSLGDTLKASLLGVLQSIPGTLASAFQGGGGVMGAIKSIGSQIGSSLGGAAGFAVGGPMGQAIGSAIGSFAGPALGKLVSVFGKSSGKAANDLRDKIIAQAGGFDALARKAVEAGTSIDALLRARDTKGVQAAADALDKALNGRANQIALAKAAMEEFGISADKAGLAFKQAEMDETAASITEKLEAMMSVGVSTEDIIAGAGDEIGAFIKRSIEMGTTVPKEWEPIVKKMIEAGTLVVSNSDAIADATNRKTDLEREFAEAMKDTSVEGVRKQEELKAKIAEANLEIQNGTTQFTDMGQVPFAQTLNDKIGAVMDKLSAFIDRILEVPDALDRIPRDVDINFNGKYNGDGDFPGFANGSRGVQDFGRGTMAILHGREEVRTERQKHADEAQRGTGGGDVGAELRRFMDRFEMVLPIALRDAMRGAR